MTLTVSLIGRPNVGKSTLFNRLVGRRASLVHDEPGLTRDRLYADAEFDGRPFLLIDTGGLELDSDESIMKMIRQQAESAIADSDAIFFVLDAQAGLLPGDLEIAAQLRATRKPVFLMVNKAESAVNKAASVEFYQLGFDRLFAVSAAHGQGLDAVFEELEILFPRPSGEYLEPEKDSHEVRVAVIGKPNAGKSSFVNKLLGEERLLVSEVPGTTLDAVDESIEYAGRCFRLIDTAGIRRKRSIFKDSEKMAVSSSLGALDRANVALLLIDASAGITEQDLKIASFVDKKGKACIIVVNKWDLSRNLEISADRFAEHIRDKMPFLSFAPILFASAKTGRHIFDVLEMAIEVSDTYKKRVPTSQVNKMLEQAVLGHQPPMVQGRRLKFFYGTQVSVAPPTFLFSVNVKEGVHFSYERFLVNRLREAFGFKGSPIRMVLRERS
ncbi:MAG: ribosome biogenesis GTPase Der [Myxococcaceae bacterium]|nr:ribosome biogenesis GTPase Der [Myxococcaceae bacterium]MBH2006717.1 ribosome biogenesis GTPase Der [Myxococcaceae bacterium]